MVEEKTPDGPELFVGLVGAIGTDMQSVTDVLKHAFASANYASDVIRLSSLLRGFAQFEDLPESPMEASAEEYYNKHMDAGNEIRKNLGESALAALAVANIRRARKNFSGDENKPIPRHIFILNSLKHPEEVNALREAYDQRFVLFSAYTPHTIRLQNLVESIAKSHHHVKPDGHEPAAASLIVRDEEEPTNRFGQNVRNTFPKADFFVDASDKPRLEKAVTRFVELLFGYPFHTPTKDEYGMFHAYAAALRSSALSRQVGAVISTVEGDVVAVGTNEVPKPEGGLYWSDDPKDARDFTKGVDPSDTQKKIVLTEMLQILKTNGWLDEGHAKEDLERLTEEASKTLSSSSILNQLFFDRTVHAEMAALADSARRTVSVKGCVLYSTAFPCHNCAKHIVASGITRVVFIEPYPKSLALQLHSDSISLESVTGETEKTVFAPFVGVAPRRYFDLFAALVRKDDNGKAIVWDRATATPRIVSSPPWYLQTEQKLAEAILERLKK